MIGIAIILNITLNLPPLMVVGYMIMCRVLRQPLQRGLQTLIISLQELSLDRRYMQNRYWLAERNS